MANDDTARRARGADERTGTTEAEDRGAGSSAEGRGGSNGAGGAPAITLAEKGDITRMIAEAGSGRRQPLQGFDPDYVDIVDYIVRCTHKIWEEGAVGLIYTHYIHNVPVWTAHGLQVGREAMVANTLRTQAAYPERLIYVDDVVWTGNDQDGFHTSMRATVVTRNTGWTAYGPPTGRRVVRRGIANCFVRENRIVEEWIAHDELAVVLQLGFDPIEAARRLARAEAARGVPQPTGEADRIVGQTVPEELPSPPAGRFDIEGFVRYATHEIWNRRMLNRIRDFCVPDFLCHTSGGRELYGRAAYRAWILELLGAFPDACMQIDHLYWLGDDRTGYRTAVRWTLTGTHDGPGPWGPPTGKRVRLMGITQHLVRRGRFVEEWNVYDEIALLKQVVEIG